MIDGGDGLRENAGMAIADAEDETADTHARRFGRDRRHRGHRFEAIAFATLRRRFLKMIGDREPIEAPFVREPPEPSHLVERSAEMSEVYPEPSTRNPSMGRPMPSG